MSTKPISVYKLPSDEEMTILFENMNNIAVVGLSPKPYRPSHRVAKHMQKFGFDIIPVRPAVTEILGKKAYKSLQMIALQIDVVNIFRSRKNVAEIIDQCIDRKVKTIWLQEGVVDEESAVKACNANILTIMDKCIYKEYVRLMK